MYVQWKLEGDALADGQNDAVRLPLIDQEEAGLDILTDGEQRCRHYIWGFVECLDGVDFNQLARFSTRRGRYGNTVNAARVVGPLWRRAFAIAPSVRFIMRHTSRPVKMALPGPMTTADTLADEYFQYRRRLAHRASHPRR